MTNSQKGTVHKIVTQILGKKKVYARWIPKQLTEAQKMERVRNARRVLGVWEKNWDELLSRLITVDETWVQYQTPETRESSREWRGSDEGRPSQSRIPEVRKNILADCILGCQRRNNG